MEAHAEESACCPLGGERLRLRAQAGYPKLLAFPVAFFACCSNSKLLIEKTAWLPPNVLLEAPQKLRRECKHASFVGVLACFARIPLVALKLPQKVFRNFSSILPSRPGRLSEVPRTPPAYPKRAFGGAPQASP